MPIPGFNQQGVLPAGIHVATWSEIRERYGYSLHRQRLLAGLERALTSFKDAGCTRFYLDGSFITAKQHPGDFDGCWEEEGVDPDRLNPALLIFDDQRALQKALFGGEMFPASSRAARNGTTFLRFFQTQKDSGLPKGIICIYLTEWDP